MAALHVVPLPLGLDERLRELVDLVPDTGLFVLGADGRILSWNDGARRITGYVASEMIGRSASALWFSANALVGSERDLPFVAGRVRYEGRRPLRRRDGSFTNVDWMVIPLGDPVAAHGFATVLRDTGAVIAAAPPDGVLVELAEQAARLADAEEMGSLGIFEVDMDTWVGRASPAACRIYGFDSDEPFRDFRSFLVRYVHPDDKQRTDEIRAAWLSAGGPQQMIEYRYLHPDGRERTLRVRRRAVRNPDGQVIRMVGTLQDVTEQRRAEAEIRASEQRYRTFVEHATDGFMLHGPGAIVLDVNEQACTMLGYTRDELIGRHPRMFDAQMTEDDYASLTTRFATGDVVTFDTVHRRRDGTTFPVEIRCRAFQYDGVPCVVSLTHDITERKRIEVQLRDNEERLRLALDVAELGTYRYDAVADVVHLSPRSQHHFGRAVEQISFGELMSWIHPDDRARVVERAIAAQTSDCGLFSDEHRILHPDGTVRWLVVEGRLYFTDDLERRPIEMIGVTRDITERKHTELALRRSEESLRRGQAIAKFTCWNVDHDPAVFRFALGDEGLPRPPSADDALALVHPDDRARVAAAWQASLAGTTFESEHRVVVDGEVRWIYARAEHERVPDGSVVHTTGVSQDISARRQLEDQVRQSQKMEAIGGLAAGVAHDFNNLLTVIAGHTEMLLRRLPLGDPAHEDVVAIREAGERAAVLTKQLLAFGRKTIVEPTLLNLNDVVASIVRMLNRLIGEDVKVTTRLDPELRSATLDRGQLEQVILNLAVNARDAMPRGGTLLIQTSNLSAADPPAVELRIEDSGCGIPEDIRDKIFEPFFTTKAPGRGTGLGLSTVYGIVAQAQGTITVESAVGKGTAVRIVLPAAAAPAPPAPAPSPPDPEPAGGETILLVEDEASVRRLARRGLESHGYRVLEAANAAEAMRHVEAAGESIDLLLTDVVMPGGGGRVLADAVLARCPRAKVLYMSGYMDDAIVRHGVETASSAFLQKPFTPPDLVRKVRATLDAT